MKTDFKNIVELMEYYKDDANCIALLERERWNGKPVCPHCSHSDKIYKTNRGYKCSACLKKFTVTVGTCFESSKIKLRYWYAAIYLCANPKKGISSHSLARTIGVTQRTAWFILHRVRKMLQDKNPALLEGIVETDETYVGGEEKNKHRQNKSGKMGRGGSKTPVLAMVERGGGVRSYALPDVKGRSLTGKMFKDIKEGSTVITDHFTGYYMVRAKFNHETINHTQDEFVRYSPAGKIHTNTVEGYFSHFKRTIYGTYHSVSVKHLNAYCRETAFRYNMRKCTDQERFIQVLRQCEGSLSYKTLVAD